MDAAAPPPEPVTQEAPSALRGAPRAGVWAWSFVGVVIAGVIIVIALAAVSEIVLPLTFAAVLAVMFKPMVGALRRKGLKPSLAAAIVVLGLLLLMTGVVAATVRGVLDQTDQIGESADAALQKTAESTDSIDIDEEALQTARDAVEDAEPALTGGLLEGLVSGVGVAVAIAGGIVLGSLIMYYLLKDGRHFREAVVSRVDRSVRAEVDDFIGDACLILRSYGRGRTAMSAIVSLAIGIAALLLGLPLVFTIMVVNFVGGYIPYIGAFLGGGLAVIVATGDGGLAKGGVMLLIVLAANLALENFVEPKIMGRTLDIHPLVVLVVTAVGGIVGGIVGLILAVPAAVIASNAMNRLRERGVLDDIADRAQPAVDRALK